MREKRSVSLDKKASNATKVQKQHNIDQNMTAAREKKEKPMHV